MKIKLIIVMLSCLVISANATVTIQFTTINGSLSNFNNGAGTSVDVANVANRLVWGILVDAGSDGFDGISSAYDDGFSLAANASGTALNLHTGAATDDVLYINSAVMASSNSAVNSPSAGEVPANQNRLLTFTGFTFTGSVTAGDSLAIMWFDTTTLGGTAASGLKYGIFQIGNVLPTDDGGSYDFGASFAGADTAKSMNFQLGVIPEPSTLMLSALGVLALLRRRR
jgi:hypothetical protein